MRYPNLNAAFWNQPLLLLPDKAEQIAAFLRRKNRGEAIPDAEITEAMAARRSTAVSRQGHTCIIPIQGVISQRVGMIERASGGISTEEVGAQLDKAMRDNKCTNIILSFDSPGGSVMGTPELADKICQYRSSKPIYGFCDPMSASAAYWLMSQCTDITCTPSGSMGSIGVYVMHADESEALKQEGIAIEFIQAGQFKIEGNGYAPLTDAARAYIQSKVDSYYSMFVSAVARGRRTSEAKVRSGMGQGRMLLAADAKQAGMCDYLGTLGDLLARVGGNAGAVVADGGGGYGPGPDQPGDLDMRSPRTVTVAEAQARVAQVERECGLEPTTSLAAPPAARPPAPPGSAEDVAEVLEKLKRDELHEREERRARRRARP
jgi:signal peptide peptidase SppA